ncbi:oxidoreductase [Cellvibrio zantedeschiae]|uniref:Oxidoreductase n=1 Tax=Cellvibrio zantedeschiae TaxID=1237077 RepID=A0ABQ3B4Y1_9GAMM|nr:Gfo/Idh/MocA family oxidoreductase [Cellvibrio zantedeschiae]GGY78475.1 oxidoreductase [Cellvibrio zantedeschiae]
MLNVALCSYGMSGKVFHAPLIAAEPQLYLHTVLQRSDKSALQDFADVQIVKNFNDILANPAIDLVVVNTPNEHHYPMTKAALLAGKHVVTEKPFTLSIAEGKELIALAEQQQKILAVFHNKRLETDHLTVQKILADETLGRVVEIEWHYDRYRNNITHKLWKEDKLPGSGTWWDLGVHMLDSMLTLFGRPQAVNADMRSLRRAEGSTDYFNVCFHYADMRALLRSSTFVSEKGATVSIHGNKGSFLKFGQDVQEQQLMNGSRPYQTNWANHGSDNIGILAIQGEGGVRRTQVESEHGCYEMFYRNIADAINGKDTLRFPAQQALLAVEMLLAADESNKLQKTILV